MITIPYKLLDTMNQYMVRALPNEGCGYLVGRDREAVQFFPMTNVLHSPYEFAFEPSEQFEIVRKVRAMGYSLMGVVHSHPYGSTTPSQKDIILADSSLLQIIMVPTKDPVELKCFCIAVGVVSSVEIEYV